ncbi:MAG: hypothetical protein IT521_00705 [Burkholderiales bacterium]|nr:hypothetical protein [Burkholderiales bacterium]
MDTKLLVERRQALEEWHFVKLNREILELMCAAAPGSTQSSAPQAIVEETEDALPK